MRRALRLAGLCACAIVLGTLQGVLLAIGLGARPVAGVLPRLFHRSTCALLGLRVHVTGRRSSAPQTIWVCNHLSYLDVSVLGALLPGRFVAKQDVRGWPVFGLLSRLQRTVFIGRRTADATQAVDAMTRALDDGAHLIVFPEGTTTGGDAVLPFRSAAFAPLVAATPVERALQPVTVAVAASRDGRDAAYAYHGDDVLVPHLARFLRRRRTDVYVTLHAPVAVATFDGDRKHAAVELQRVVASALPSPAAA